MAENSKISWTTHTFNPWIGCAKVSQGCKFCYAATLNERYKWVTWGPGEARRRTSVANWNKVRAWDRDAAKSGIRPRVFCASLADWLDEEVPAAWMADLLCLIRDTPNLDWLLLSKRPENWRGRIESIKTKDESMAAWLLGWLIANDPPSNVWIGTTVEDQENADKRIPVLLDIPARVRFLSCEPLIGPVDLENERRSYLTDIGRPGAKPVQRGVDWVICGGESGAKARPMYIAWARSLRDQCAIAGVPFHFKQWGSNPDASAYETPMVNARMDAHNGGNLLYGTIHDAVPSAGSP